MDVTQLQYELWELKTHLNDVMQEIRECPDAGREFKYLVNKKINIAKRIKALEYKLTEWQKE